MWSRLLLVALLLQPAQALAEVKEKVAALAPSGLVLGPDFVPGRPEFGGGGGILLGRLYRQQKTCTKGVRNELPLPSSYVAAGLMGERGDAILDR